VIGQEFVLFSFLYIKLFELGVEVASNNRSAILSLGGTLKALKGTSCLNEAKLWLVVSDSASGRKILSFVDPVRWRQI
jgi:hypothetical protein